MPGVTISYGIKVGLNRLLKDARLMMVLFFCVLLRLVEFPTGDWSRRRPVLEKENQNCTVITLRMKHRRMRWSVSGANNLAKALYRKENRELIDTNSL
jgi:hypothetical protein